MDLSEEATKYYQNDCYCYEIKHTPTMKRENLENMNFEIKERYLHL